MATTKIRHIKGNRIEIRFPMTERIVQVVNGNTTVDEQAMTPVGTVKVLLTRFGAVKYAFDATVSEGYAAIIDNGTIDLGEYWITVIFVDSHNHPMRYKKNTILEVVDETAQGGEYNTNEFDVIAYYPVINGRESAIVVEDGKVYIEVGGRFGEDDDPNDGKAVITSGYGEGEIVQEDNKIILYI